MKKEESGKLLDGFRNFKNFVTKLVSIRRELQA